MFRLIRFLIIALTLGRIKWIMRLTWVWRLVVFLGITGWLSRKLKSLIGLDKRSGEMDSAWSEALRYTPTPAPAGAAAAPGVASPQQVARAEAVKPSAPVVEETRSEVTGIAEDGSSETITMHEVRVGDDAETIVRIEDETGSVETLVTGSPVEEIDLANLGEPAEESIEPVIEIVETEIAEEAAVDEILDVLEAAEPELPPVEEPPAKPKRKRASKPKDAEVAEVAEPLEVTDEDPDPDVLIEPDWVRGDGTVDCPESHPVKAKVSSMIYYVPENGHYGLTVPDVCFASDADAQAAGYRPPRRG